MPPDFVKRYAPRHDVFIGTEPRQPIPTVFEAYAPPLEVLRRDAEARPQHYGQELIRAIHNLQAGEPVVERLKTDLVLTWQRRTAAARPTAVVKKKPEKKDPSFEEQDYAESIDLGAGDFVLA